MGYNLGKVAKYKPVSFVMIKPLHKAILACTPLCSNFPYGHHESAVMRFSLGINHGGDATDLSWLFATIENTSLKLQNTI